LSALERSAPPIVVGVTDDRVPTALLEQIGLLRGEGERRVAPGLPPYLGWAQAPESEVSADLRAWLTVLREDLVRLGADSATGMSDSELMAAGVRVRWKLRQHLRGEETLVEADGLSALAKEIAAGPSGPTASDSADAGL
jgi:hypothetical protein